MLPHMQNAVKAWVQEIQARRAADNARKRKLIGVQTVKEAIRGKAPMEVFEAVAEAVVAKPPPSRRLRRWEKDQRKRVHKLEARRKAALVGRVNKQIAEFKQSWIWGLRRRADHNAHVLEPRSAFESGQAFARFLMKRGYSLIGEGHYSMVLWKKGNKVIKVNKHSHPDGWVDYVMWAQKHGYAGKQAPLVYSYKFFKGKKSNFYVALMEKFETTGGKLERQHPMKLLPTLLQFSDNPKAQEFAEMLSPGTFEFQRHLEKSFKNSLDMHGGNYMYRADGSFAWTDPVSGSSRTTVTRFRAKTTVPARTVYSI